MLVAIEFHNEMNLPAGEIGEIRPNWLLANEFPTIQAPVSNFEPEFSFGFVIRLTKSTRTRCSWLIRSPHCRPRILLLPLTLTLSP